MSIHIVSLWDQSAGCRWWRNQQWTREERWLRNAVLMGTGRTEQMLFLCSKWNSMRKQYGQHSTGLCPLQPEQTSSRLRIRSQALLPNSDSRPPVHKHGEIKPQGQNLLFCWDHHIWLNIVSNWHFWLLWILVSFLKNNPTLFNLFP